MDWNQIEKAVEKIPHNKKRKFNAIYFNALHKKDILKGVHSGYGHLDNSIDGSGCSYGYCFSDGKGPGIARWEDMDMWDNGPYITHGMAMGGGDYAGQYKEKL